MKKIFVLDTNVLLHDPKALFAFEDNEVIVPLVVLEELDGKKSGREEISRNAREVIRSLDKLRLIGSINKGVGTSAGGTIRVELGKQNNIPEDWDSGKPDNMIISVARSLAATHSESEVIMVSRDINVRVKCDSIGIVAEDYKSDYVVPSTDAIYTGVVEFEAADCDIDELHAIGNVENKFKGLLANQYVHVRSEDDHKKTALARFDYESGSLIKARTPFSVWGIAPRNMEQALVFDALFNPDIKLVTIMGTSGCGKTLVSAAAGISQLLDSNIYKKVIMSRPVVPMGRDIGFLPGNVDEKMAPWMAPLQDSLDLLFSDKGSNMFDMYCDQGLIEVTALAHIRGRSIPNSYIIIDEIQNLSRHEVKTIITRVGEGTKIVMTGDIMQIDTPHLDSLDNGLSYVVEKFKDDPLAAHIMLKHGERSALATRAAEIL